MVAFGRQSSIFGLCTTTIQDPLVTHLGLQGIVPVDLGFKLPDLCFRSSELRVLLRASHSAICGPAKGKICLCARRIKKVICASSQRSGYADEKAALYTQQLRREAF